MAQISNDIATKAEAINAQLQRETAAIKADANLSDRGRRIQLAQVYSKSREQMDALKATHETSTAQAIESSTRSLFGHSALSGSDAISVRDATARAEQITTPDEAAELYRKAANNGDDHLAKAIAQRVYEEASDPNFGEAWMPVLAQHAERTPGFESKVDELFATQSPGDGIFTAAHFHLSKPDEFGRLSDYSIAEIAQASQDGAVA